MIITYTTHCATVVSSLSFSLSLSLSLLCWVLHCIPQSTALAAERQSQRPLLVPCCWYLLNTFIFVVLLMYFFFYPVSPSSPSLGAHTCYASFVVADVDVAVCCCCCRWRYSLWLLGGYSDLCCATVRSVVARRWIQTRRNRVERNTRERYTAKALAKTKTKAEIEYNYEKNARVRFAQLTVASGQWSLPLRGWNVK